MTNKSLCILCVFLSVTACGKDGGSNSGSTSSPSGPTPNSNQPSNQPVQGNDYSGTYQLQDVECFDSVSGQMVAQDYLSPSSSAFLMTINGNNLSYTINGTSCTTADTSRVVFDNNGEVFMTNNQITVSGGSSCTTYTIPNGPVPLYPSQIEGTSTSGPADSINTYYIYNQGAHLIGIFSKFKLEAQPSDPCFIVFWPT